MKKVIIFGVTQFAEILSHYIEREGVCEIAGYTVTVSYTHLTLPTILLV